MLEGTILVNKYRLVKLLGSGGSGEVYLAERVGIGGDVAIKFIRSDIPQASLAKEAKILAGLQHPNICQFIDFVEQDHSSFIVMEYLYGTDLSHFLRHHVYKNKIELEIVIFIFRSILNALSFAHEKEILHRDIKPANIFITNHHQVKLLDFGISRHIKDGTLTTSAMQFTPLYTSPELFIDMKHTLNNYKPHNDLYSLALVIYELITNKKAFSSLDELQKGMIDFSLLNKEYSILIPFLKKMLQINPDDRYQSAKSTLEELDILLGSKYGVNSKLKILQIPEASEVHEQTVYLKKNKSRKKELISFFFFSFLLLFSWVFFKNKPQAIDVKKINTTAQNIVSQSDVEFFINDSVFTFSSSSLNLLIGLGPIEKWTISKNKISCTSFTSDLSCQASIMRDGNFEIVFMVSDGQINRITFNADKGADKELNQLINSFLKLGESLPDKVIGGINFKSVKLKDQLLTYQNFPHTTMAMFELAQKN
jgi:serine/threonine protein kinase